jgi:hypothetical protein
MSTALAPCPIILALTPSSPNSRHTTKSVARLRGDFGDLSFVIKVSDNSCGEARSHLHQQSLQGLENRINGMDIIDYPSFDEAMRRIILESSAEDPEIGYRILGTGKGDTKATLQIGDTKSDV